MNIQIISHNKRGGAQVVLKSVEVLHGKTRSVTLHLDEMWRDKWGQRYDKDFKGNQASVDSAFLAEWYGNRAVTAIRTNKHTADALIRTAIRYAFIALPEAEPVVEAA